jgi:hypothetical protein
MSSQGAPHRRHPRFRLLRRVHLCVLGRADKGLPSSWLCALRDISRGGAFIRTTSVVPIGTQVSVAFEVQGRVLRLADAVVTWIRWPRVAMPRGSFPGCGVEFVDWATGAMPLLMYLERALPPVEARGTAYRVRVPAAPVFVPEISPGVAGFADDGGTALMGSG